ncbi:MAG: DUF502 domain-containing protein [Saprospiraceae bacterium]|nr:DUF502 domain-containing protein [Saprospiraceae bacterium]
MMKRLRKFLVTTLIGGFLVILPLAILVLVIQLILNLVRNLLDPLSDFIRDEFELPVPDLIITLIAFAVVISFCFLVGLFVRTQIGKNLFSGIEKTYLSKIPLYGSIKETVQQFSGSKKMPFSDVVLVDVFGSDTRMTGFITDEHPSGNYTVFVPTGPNPTNGFIFHMKREQIQFLDSVKTDDAMRSIIGVGVGSSSIMKF